MKVFVLLFLLLSIPALAAPKSTVHVRGTTTKSGEYRQPHYQTAPNKTQRDNYSAKGNVNPYTGKSGTKTPKK